MAIRTATQGPPVTAMSKEKALEALQADPQFPKEAKDVTIFENNGRWSAAWNEPDFKIADFPGSDESTAPESKDSEGSEPSGPPKDDKPDDGGGSSDSGDGGESGPPKHDHGDSGEHGEKGGTDQKILHLLETLFAQLGISPEGEGESPIPGEDGPPGMGAGPQMPPPPGPPGGPPPGAGGPPGMGGKQVIQHEKALKPGEAPPGATPIGAPSFASVAPKGHPWEKTEKASFHVAEYISEDTKLSDIDAELRRIAQPTVFKVKQVTEARTQDGRRIASALISKY